METNNKKENNMLLAFHSKKEIKIEYLTRVKEHQKADEIVKGKYWLLVDKIDGIIKYARTDAQKKAIQDIGDMYARKINGESISIDVWPSLRAAAAAYAAADAAWRSTKENSRIKQMNKLLEFLKAAPVVKIKKVA